MFIQFQGILSATFGESESDDWNDSGDWIKRKGKYDYSFPRRHSRSPPGVGLCRRHCERNPWIGLFVASNVLFSLLWGQCLQKYYSLYDFRFVRKTVPLQHHKWRKVLIFNDNKRSFSGIVMFKVGRWRPRGNKEADGIFWHRVKLLSEGNMLVIYFCIFFCEAMFVLDEMGNGTQERLKKYLQYISRICLNIQSIYSEQPDRKLGPVCTPKCENRLECLVSSYNWRSTKYNLQILPPHMRGAQEDLYWRVCRIMTKDGAQEVFLGRHHPTFSPIISPKKHPHTTNAQHPVWPQRE